MAAFVLVDEERYIAPFVSKGTNTYDYGYYLATGTGYQNHRADMQLASSIAGGIYLHSDTRLEVDQWYHIAAVRNGSQVRIYVNGVLDSIKSCFAEGIRSNDLSLDFGTHGQNYFMKGKLDEIRVYNRALSDEEVWQLYSPDDDWRVEVLADTVCAGCKDRWVDFKFYWPEELSAITVPIVVREITPGSFWTGNLPFDYLPLRSISQRVTWKWPVSGWADIVQEVRPVEGCATPGNGYDGVSPDNFVISAAGASPLPPQPGGWLCVTLNFDVTNVPGTFLFDTACATVNLRKVYMVDGNAIDHGPAPGTGELTFKPAVMTIGGCDCARHGDMNLDGKINAVDVVIAVNWVYRLKDSRMQIPTCPGINGDWNCNGLTDPVDVVLYVNYVYKSQTQFPPCDPCACDPYPTNCPPWP